MNSINITTSQNIDVEYELASVGDRIIGRIIDWIVLFAYIVLIAFFIGFSKFGNFGSGLSWLLILLIIFPVIFYDLLCEMQLNGQSVGKKVMGIKVISLTGGQPTFSQYLIRWVFRLIDFTFSGSLLALIMVAASAKKQRLGDLIAGTAVVKTKLQRQLNDTIYEPLAEDTYLVNYPEVIHLKDSDIQLIKEVISNVEHSGNTMVALQAQQKIEQVLHIMSKQAEPVFFLKTILSDYNYVTSKL